MVIAIFLTLQNKLRGIPGQENDRIHRLDILRMRFLVYLVELFSCARVVANKSAIVLVAVQFKHIDALVVRTPRYVREVTVGRIARFQIYGAARFHVIYAHSYLMRHIAGHRILVRFVCGNFRKHIHLRIVCHHALVHSVESELLAVVAPECSLHYSELVAVYRLTVDDFP